MSCRWRASVGFAFAIAAVLSAQSAWAAPNLTVDGAQTAQTIDGLGVNINVNSWNGGQLKPALDLLVDVHGSSLFRVIRDPMDWVASESQIAALHTLDAATLQQVYEAPQMQDIWSTIGYLNQKGVRGRAVMLNFMGWTPTWLGGSGAYGAASHITPGKEGEWATMVASLVYYGRKVKNLDFTLLGPLNEEDWNCLEGPCVDATQYTTCLARLAAELDGMGLSDVRLVGPDCAGDPGPYVPPMMANATVAAKVDRIGLHTYGGAASPGTAYPGKSYWLTETAASCSNCDYAGTPAQGEWTFASDTNDRVLDDLANGLTGVLLYDGYDSFYYHHNSLGFWGLLASSSNNYTPRKRFYVNAQIARFVRPGMVRIGATDSVSTLGTIVAFRGAAGELTIVGHANGGAAAIDGALLNVPAIDALSLYETSTSQNLARGTDVPVTGGAFTVQIPNDTFFTLTSVTAVSSGGDAGAAGDAGADGDATVRDASGAPGDASIADALSGPDEGGAGGSTPSGAPSDDTSGCSCAVSHRAADGATAAALALLVLAAQRRSARHRRRTKTVL